MEKKELVYDIIEITAKTCVSAIPIGGALITSVWDAIKNHSMQSRLDEWKELVESRLSNCERTLEELGENEIFVSAMIKATEIAIKTSADDKRVYLANVIKNVIDVEINESVIMMYMQMLEKYTAWHINILKYFKNPDEMTSNNYAMGSAMQPLLKVFPELVNNEDIIRIIVNDLQNDGLLHKGNYLDGTVTASGMMAKRTTEFGDKFIDFICNEQI